MVVAIGDAAQSSYLELEARLAELTVLIAERDALIAGRDALIAEQAGRMVELEALVADACAAGSELAQLVEAAVVGWVCEAAGEEQQAESAAAFGT